MKTVKTIRCKECNKRLYPHRFDFDRSKTTCIRCLDYLTLQRQGHSPTTKSVITKCEGCKKKLYPHRFDPKRSKTTCIRCLDDTHYRQFSRQPVHDRNLDRYNKSILVKEDLIKFLGGGCERCGLSLCKTYPAVCFDFHHKDPTTKEFNVAAKIRSGLNRDRVIAELKKCQLLCANCHRIVHLELRQKEEAQLVITHQNSL